MGHQHQHRIRKQHTESRRQQQQQHSRKQRQPSHDNIANPEMLTPEDILMLQRTVGNAAVQRMISRTPDSGKNVIQRRKVISEDLLVLGKVTAYKVDALNSLFARNVTAQGPMQAGFIHARKDITTSQWLNTNQGVNAHGPVWGTGFKKQAGKDEDK